MKLRQLHEDEGLLRRGAKWAKEKIKKHGPPVAKAVGKASLKALEKGTDIAAGAIEGAAKGAYQAATTKKPKREYHTLR
jgi:hypothetical protein